MIYIRWLISPSAWSLRPARESRSPRKSIHVASSKNWESPLRFSRNFNRISSNFRICFFQIFQVIFFKQNLPCSFGKLYKISSNWWFKIHDFTLFFIISQVKIKKLFRWRKWPNHRFFQKFWKSFYFFFQFVITMNLMKMWILANIIWNLFE